MKEKKTSYIVIGLGRFGQSLCLELSKSKKCEVFAVDKSQEEINEVKDIVNFYAVCDATDEASMLSIGIKNFDVAVICIGNDMELSILTSLLCKQFGIKKVVSKAKSEKHKIVLEKLGLDLVIIPEYEMGKKLALKLLNPLFSEIYDLGQNIGIIEIDVPKSWDKLNMVELDIRKKYKVNALLIKRSDELITNISGETVVFENDTMVLVGNNLFLERFASKIK